MAFILTMTDKTIIQMILLFIISILVFIYLCYVLVKPEKF